MKLIVFSQKFVGMVGFLAISPNVVSGSTGSERIICAAVWYKEIPIKKEIQHQQELTIKVLDKVTDKNGYGKIE